MNQYVVSSLELHLFFGRIMKEHAFFLEAGFTPANPDFQVEARKLKVALEELLHKVVDCSRGIVGEHVLNSGEIMTEYTHMSEQKSCMLTGASIDDTITMAERELWNSCNKGYLRVNNALVDTVRQINQRYLKLVKALICLKEQILQNVLECKMYTINYPLLIDHIIREAKLYVSYIEDLESNMGCRRESLREVEMFWNRIMMEHAFFIRGLLDPTENDLILKANNFAGQYSRLLTEAKNRLDQTMPDRKGEVLNQTMEYRDFKKAGAKGINECKVKSLILPLLADHVLREANHYIRLLEEK